MSKKNKLCRVLALSLVLALGLCGLIGCGRDEAAETQPETTQAPPTEYPLEMKYLTVMYPAALEGVLQHRQETGDAAVAEIFSMGDQELYRIFFGGTEGELYGYLTVDGKALPVSFTVSEVQAEDQEAYGTMMDLLNAILQEVSSDSRYSSPQSGAALTYADSETRHWTVSLPDTMSWEEVEELGVYRVDYYGTVRGERIRLYTITLGETAPENQLGTLKVSGEKLPVGIISYGVQPGTGWTEEETNSLYVQLDTVNLVIQAIMQSKNFSA